MNELPSFSPGLKIMLGVAEGYSITHKFGQNAVIGTTFAPVCRGGLYPMPQPAAATALRVKAGDANDDASGTGAREVTIMGLDETGTEVTETLATAGASASSATTATFIRLYRVFVSSSGTYATIAGDSHAADIVIENAAGTEDWLTVSGTGFGRSQSETGVFSIPAGKSGYVLSSNVATDAAKVTEVLFVKREGITDAAAPYSAMRTQFEFTIKGGEQEFSQQAPVGPIVGPADCGFLAKVDTGTATVDVDFEVLIVDN